MELLHKPIITLTLNFLDSESKMCLADMPNASLQIGHFMVLLTVNVWLDKSHFYKLGP